MTAPKAPMETEHAIADRSPSRGARKPPLPLLAAVACGLGLFYVALLSTRVDWFIAEIHAQLLYGALSEGQYPFYSFAYNGGSYFVQDPQSILFSPTALWIAALGPTLGLRFSAFFWGLLGTLVMQKWLARRMSATAALFAAVSWTLSAGFLWRLSAGNDMFLWYLGVPWLLHLLERLFEKPRLTDAVGLGLLAGIYILGPTIHTWIYIAIPTIVVWIFVLALYRIRTLEALGKVGLFGSIALVTALSVGSVRLAVWKQFSDSMSRAVYGGSTLLLPDVLTALFDYSHATIVPVKPEPAYRHPGYTSEESQVALNPAASVLAILGLGAVWSSRVRRRDPIACLVLVVGVLGLMLTMNFSFWITFLEQTHNRFRVAERFLVLPAFGLAILCGFGLDTVLSRLRNRRELLFGIYAVAALSVFGWVHRAKIDLPNAQGAFAYQDPSSFTSIKDGWSELTEKPLPVRTLVSFRSRGVYRPELLKGVGFHAAFPITGARVTAYPDSGQGLPLIEGVPAESVRGSHRRLEFRGVPPAARIVLHARIPAFGAVLRTVPEGLDVALLSQGADTVIENRSGRVLETLEYEVLFPIGMQYPLISVGAILLAAAFLARQWHLVRLKNQSRPA